MRLAPLLTFAALGVFTLWWAFKRSEREDGLTRRIASEGGEILGRGAIGMLVTDPFTHSTTDAAGHWIRTKYGERVGTWYVRTSSARPAGEWLWVDAAGAEGLPVARSDDSRPVRSVRRVPHLVAVVLVLTILAGFAALGGLAGRR
jgi:hypothetical protein